MTLKQIWKILRKTVSKFFKENSFQDSAAIAYYTIFSLPGISIITVLVASSFFYDNDTVRNELLEQISLLMGQNSADQVEQIMNSDFFSYDSMFMKVLGTIVLIISTTTVFISLQNSLNKIWRVRSRPKKVLLKLIINRLISLALVASIGFLLLVSLGIDTLIAMFKFVLSDYLMSYSIYIIMAINFLFSTLIYGLVFSLIYKVLPDVDIRWKDVWIGTVFTTVLFLIGKYLIASYLSTNNLADAYGAAGSLVALLAWVYYSVLILLFGAQFTYVFSEVKGTKVAPARGAVSIEIVEVEKEKNNA